MNPLSPTQTVSSLSPSSPTSTTTSMRSPQRPPPPSLLLGPPSHNVSDLSLPSLHPTNTSISVKNPISQSSAPLFRSRSNRAPESVNSASPPLGRSLQQQQQQRQNQSEGDRTDALWAEMQATLAEVELSASRGTHFFGPEHSAALEELRASQIALAQAWARSEVDEIVEHPGEGQGEVSDAGVKAQSVKPTSKGDTGETKSKGKSVGMGLEEETEEDILLARRRREANDKYFWRVNNGVLDVVGKLEGVAVAMGKVERESREIWTESESIGSGSIKTS